MGLRSLHIPVTFAFRLFGVLFFHKCNQYFVKHAYILPFKCLDHLYWKIKMLV